MKKLIKTNGKAWRCLLCMLPVALILAGCEVARRIVWSPDGNHAVILTGTEMVLCDRSGNLSGPVMPDVSDAVWFHDSQRLLLAREQTRTNWKTLAVDLAPETKEAVRQVSDVLLARLQARIPRDKLGDGLEKEQRHLTDAALLYLRDERPEETRMALINRTNRLDDETASLHVLQSAHLVGNQLELDGVLKYDLRGTGEIRISPDDKLIAYAADGWEELAVTSADGKQPVQKVDKPSGPFDWSPDSRSLVYLRPEGSDAKETVVASLKRRQVINDAGRIEVTGDAEELAGLFNDGSGRVRWLRDGRIIFATMEVQLPATTQDMPQRQELFALDMERQATLTRLIPRGSRDQMPAELGNFELGPDEKRIVVAGREGRVVVFTLASGDVAEVQSDTGTDLKLLPVWRGTNEVCYAYVSKPDKDDKRTVEVALWQAGRTNAVLLSTNWPTTIRTNWIN
jgi:hypothetical protein